MGGGALALHAYVLIQLAANEWQNKHHYLARVSDIEHAAFTPPAFPANGMCAQECKVFLQELARQIVDYNPDLSYPVVLNSICCKGSFCLPLWRVICLRRNRPSYYCQSSFVSECHQLRQHLTLIQTLLSREEPFTFLSSSSFPSSGFSFDC